MASNDFSRSQGGSDKKGPWSAEEDAILKHEKESNQAKWADIANVIPGRSAKQCRERWEQNIKPGLIKGPITEEESQIIMQLVDIYGKKWAQISKDIPTRSDNAIKNWYNGMCQKFKGRSRTNVGYLNVETHFSAEHQRWLEIRYGKGQQPTQQQNAHHVHRFTPYARPLPYQPQSHQQIQMSGYPAAMPWNEDTRAALQLPPLRPELVQPQAQHGQDPRYHPHVYAQQPPQQPAHSGYSPYEVARPTGPYPFHNVTQITIPQARERQFSFPYSHEGSSPTESTFSYGAPSSSYTNSREITPNMANSPDTPASNNNQNYLRHRQDDSADKIDLQPLVLRSVDSQSDTASEDQDGARREAMSVSAVLNH